MNTILKPVTSPHHQSTGNTPQLSGKTASLDRDQVASMKAIYLNQANSESFLLGTIPRPHPQEGEALIKVHATAVMPSEFDWYPTFNTVRGESRPFPIVLSHEFSGVVESINGPDDDLKIGDCVYGLNDWFSNGAQAEYCTAPLAMLARKPQSLDHSHAAIVPISALTAWQGLFEKTKLEPGQHILIHGGAGGVGSFAVQLAHWCGAHVIATASTANLTFVRSLGAERVIDYRTTRFEDVIHNVDVVFDCVGGDTLNRSWPVLRPTGNLVTVVSQYGDTTEARDRDAFMLVRADGEQLTQIASLIDEGLLRVFLEDTFPLEKTRDAYARAQQGGMRGKIALQVIV